MTYFDLRRLWDVFNSTHTQIHTHTHIHFNTFHKQLINQQHHRLLKVERPHTQFVFEQTSQINNHV